MKTTNYSRSRMRGKLSSTVLKTSTGGDTCTEFIQGQNRKEALHILTARVNQLHIDRKSAEYDNLREKQMKGQNGGRLGGRGDKIRTYNFIKSRVVDHRLGLRTGNVKEVMKGNLKVLFESQDRSGEDD